MGLKVSVKNLFLKNIFLQFCLVKLVYFRANILKLSEKVLKEFDVCDDQF